MLYDLGFPNNTNLSCFFSFFLIIDLSFLIPALITQNFNPTAKLVIAIEIPIKEAKVEIQLH